MAVQVVEARARADAPAQIVWDVIADVRRYPEWAGTTKAELEREGAPDPDGVGAIRRMQSRRRGRTVVVREEVTTFDPPARLGYRMLSGVPVRDYAAEVTVAPRDGGSELHWRSRFRPRFPGTGRLLKRALDDVIAELTARAAREAERRARERGPG